MEAAQNEDDEESQHCSHDDDGQCAYAQYEPCNQTAADEEQKTGDTCSMKDMIIAEGDVPEESHRREQPEDDADRCREMVNPYDDAHWR